MTTPITLCEHDAFTDVFGHSRGLDGTPDTRPDTGAAAPRADSAAALITDTFAEALAYRLPAEITSPPDEKSLRLLDRALAEHHRRQASCPDTEVSALLAGALAGVFQLLTRGFSRADTDRMLSPGIAPLRDAEWQEVTVARLQNAIDPDHVLDGGQALAGAETAHRRAVAATLGVRLAAMGDKERLAALRAAAGAQSDLLARRWGGERKLRRRLGALTALDWQGVWTDVLAPDSTTRNRRPAHMTVGGPRASIIEKQMLTQQLLFELDKRIQPAP